MEKRPNLYALTGSMFYFLSKDYSEFKNATSQDGKEKTQHRRQIHQENSSNHKQL